VIDYSGEEPLLRHRPGSEMSIRGRRETISKFNGGSLDAIILNQAGATGLSLHASEKYKDQRQRHMMIAQAEGNIDTHMQMLGRVHRTGQVIVPKYSQLVADIPAEKRPAAVLAKKMASLNANTTASREGALTSKDVPDFINEYGDMIAATIVADDMALNTRLGSPVKIDENGKVTVEEAMRRLTGRIPLLPLKEQEELYSRLEADYEALIQQMDAAGENALEAKTLDLKAQGIERTIVVPAKSGLDSPFAAPVYIEKTSIARQGKPFSADELIERVADQLDIPASGRTDNAERILESLQNPHSAIGSMAFERERLAREDALEEFDTYRRGVVDEIEDPIKAKKELDKLNATRDRWSDLHEMVRVGARMTLVTSSGNFTAIVLKTDRPGQAQNPLALSSWKTTFAVADASRQVILPFSRMFMDGKSSSEDKHAIELRSIGWAETAAQTIERFASMQTASREQRYIATGNLLAAYDWLNLKGRIINYTDAQGHIRQGILTAKDFDLGKHYEQRARPIREPSEVVKWMRDHKGELMWSEDNVVRLEMYYDKDLYITVEGNKRKGGVYFLDKALTDITRDFYKRGGTMVANVQGANSQTMERIVARLQALGATFVDRTEAKAPPAEKIEQAEDSGEKHSVARLARTPGAQRRRADVEAELSEIVERVVGRRARVQFEDTIPLNGTVGWGSYGAQHQTAAGNYTSATALIRLAMADPAYAGTERDTAYHEAFHALEHLIWQEQGPERLVLAREDQRLRQWIAQNMRFTPVLSPKQLAELAPYEVRALAFEGYVHQREMGRGNGTGIHTALRRGFERLLQAIRRIRNALQGYGYKTAEDVFSDIYEGKVRERADRAERSTMAGAAAAADRGERYSVRRRAAGPDDVIPAPETVRGALAQPNKTLRERWTDALDAALLTPARSIWDRQIDLARFQKAAEAMNGRIVESLDTYLAATLFPGRVGERMKDAARKLWEPVYDAMRDNKVTPAELHEYLYARHAPERNAAIREIDPANDAGSGMTDAEAAEVMGSFLDRRTQFEAVAALADKIVEHNRDLMVREGLESTATVQQWTEAYNHYMPLKGFESDADDEMMGSPSTGRGFDIRNPETYRALGRFDRADNILANLFDQTQRTIVRAEKNRVAKTFLRFAQANESPFYRIGLAEKKRRINPLTGLVEEYWTSLPKHLDRVFAAKVGGKTYFIEIRHEGLLQALKTLGMTKMPGLLRLAARLTREYSRFQTAKNPEFVMRNFEKDIQDAALNISAEQRDRYLRRFWINYPRAVLASVIGTAEKGEGTQSRRWYDEWREAGGKISFYGFHDFEQIQKQIERELAQRLESTGKAALMALPRLIDPINGKAVKLLEAISEVSESATRLAVYMAGRDIGLSKAKAAEMARNATVDFNRRGHYGHVMNALYAFSGANVQGNVNTLRRLRKSKTMRRAAYSLVVAGMITTLWNMAVSPEDEDKKRAYEKLKYWQREKNIHVYWPGAKRPLKLPTGFAVVPFWMLGENLAMLMLGKQKPFEMVGNYLGTVADAFNPMGSQGSFFDLARWARTLAPTVARPVVEIPLNQNWAGNRIRPDEMPWNRHLPHSEQFKAFTDPYAIEVARWVNAATGGNKFEPGAVSPYPDNLQYLWDFALGGLGRFMNNTRKAIADTIDGVDVPPDRLPFVRNIVGPDTTDTSGQQESYYKARSEEQAKTQRLRAAIKSRAEGTDGGSADEVIERLARETGAQPSRSGKGISVPSDTIFRSADTQIKDLRRQEDAIRKDDKISRADKKTKIDDLREQMRSIMRESRQRLPAAQ
jgi:hypothetical protein